MNELIKGAYDLHVHSGPDLLQRKVDDLEMAERCINAGMKGFISKSHYFCTAERAKLVNKLYPKCNAMGSIVLNSMVGGINPMAVELAGRSGAKMVWFPTVDSENEQEYLNTHSYKAMPYWALVQKQMKEDGIDPKPINILHDGKLMNEVYEVLDVIAKYNMIVATSHISQKEGFALVKAAKERKVDRIVVTHVTFPSTIYSIEEQKELVKYGALMEHCYTTLVTKKCERSVMMDEIRQIGAENVLITTDLGQMANDYPEEGLSNFADILSEEGFTDEEIVTMIVKNSSALVE